MDASNLSPESQVMVEGPAPPPSGSAQAGIEDDREAGRFRLATEATRLPPAISVSNASASPSVSS
jgi:hypothetical protein